MIELVVIARQLALIKEIGMGENSEQVIPNTENEKVAKLACALEIMNQVSNMVKSPTGQPLTPEERADRLTEILKEAYESISELA